MPAWEDLDGGTAQIDGTVLPVAGLWPHPIAALKAFTRSMEIVLPSEKALPYVADQKAFGTIALLARRRYRDHTLFDVQVYGEKVRR